MAFTPSPVVERALKSDARLNSAASSLGKEAKILKAVQCLTRLLTDWNEHQSSGRMALERIIKYKEKLGFKMGSLQEGPTLDSLEQACSHLSAAVDNLNSIVQSMKTIAYQINILANLDKGQNQKTAKIPVFPLGTWDCSKYSEVFENIADSFSENLEVLKIIRESAAQSQSRATLTVYMARWNYACQSSNAGVRMLILGLYNETNINS